jgi:hypothetical protein
MSKIGKSERVTHQKRTSFKETNRLILAFKPRTLLT